MRSGFLFCNYISFCYSIINSKSAEVKIASPRPLLCLGLLLFISSFLSSSLSIVLLTFECVSNQSDKRFIKADYSCIVFSASSKFSS